VRTRRTPNRGQGEPSEAEVHRLKALVQTFTRSFGLLVTKETPCGYPVSASYAHCLMVLLECDEGDVGTSQTALGARLGIDKSNVARLCSRLESSGHATQTRDPADGRGRLLSLTTKGRRIAKRIEVASHDRFQRVAQALPPRKRATVLAALEALTSAVQALDDEG